MNLLFILADVIQQCWSFVLVYFDKPQLLLTQRQNNFWHYIEKWRESRVSFIKDTAWHYRNWSVTCNSTKDPVFTVCTFLRVLLQSSCSSPITGTKYQWAAEASLPKEFHANLLKMRTITKSGLLGNFLKLPANSSQAPLWFISKGHHLYLPAIPVAVSMYWVLHRKQSTYECQQCWAVVKLCFTLRGWCSVRFSEQVMNVKVSSIKIQLDHYYLAFTEFPKSVKTLINLWITFIDSMHIHGILPTPTVNKKSFEELGNCKLLWKYTQCQISRLVTLYYHTCRKLLDLIINLRIPVFKGAALNGGKI